MRLWHEALIPYLPRQQLLGLHREVCALRGLGWGKPHSVVNYVFEHPYGWLVAYHLKVMREMVLRGYHPDKKWYEYDYRGKHCAPCAFDCSKIKPYAGERYKSIPTCCVGCLQSEYIYPEHNAAYLQECLENLEGKGIHIEMGAER